MSCTPPIRCLASPPAAGVNDSRTVEARWGRPGKNFVPRRVTPEEEALMLRKYCGNAEPTQTPRPSGGFLRGPSRVAPLLS